MFALLSTLAELLSAHATRFLGGRAAARDVDVAAHLLRIVLALQDLAVRGERLLALGEALTSGGGAERAEEFAGLLDRQLRALDELDAVLAESRPLLATVDVGFYPDLAPLLDAKSGLLTRWRQQVSQSRFSTTTLFFLPSDSVRALTDAARDAGGPRSLEFVSAVADRLHEVRRHEIRDLRDLSDLRDLPDAARTASGRELLRAQAAAARADLARATDLCARLHAAVEQAVGAEALAGLRRRLLPRARPDTA